MPGVRGEKGRGRMIDPIGTAMILAGVIILIICVGHELVKAAVKDAIREMKKKGEL